MQESLRLLRTERVDLMQIHNLVDWQTHYDTLQDWKAQGRIRYLGVTHYHAGAHAQLEAVLRAVPLDFVQLNYSLAETQAAERLLPLARERGLAVIVNRPFARGALFRATRGQALPDWAAEFDCASWAQFFLKWILAHPAVTVAIPGTGKLHHAQDNLAAATGRLPDAAQRARMQQLIGAL
jgi:aryl-alcohol dehydrogenase-like predicted oxidoreductase